MIHTIRTVAVGDKESKIDSPIILYRGDREVEVEFTINGSKFTFTNGGNVIKSTNATHGQLVINTPTGENMFSEVTECHDGKVVFVITKEMIDELIEVGFYSFQIRLFDEYQVSRVTIPPVLKGIDIRNPIAAEDETNVVDIALVDYSVIVKDQFEDLSTFLPDGNYNKTEWESKDVISGAKLNKIEDALYNINSNMEASDLALFNKVEHVIKNRLDALEGVNADSRLDALEDVNADSRLDALEDVNADSRLDALEDVNADSRLDALESSSITPEYFGAIGDGKSDDTAAFKRALSHCRETQQTLTLKDKQYYITETLNIGSVKIRSFSGVPGHCDVMFLQKPDKTYWKNSPSWNYYYNIDTSTTWREVINNCAYGCCIISDKNIDILKAYGGEKIDIDGVCVIGNHRAVNQNGISDEAPGVYMGNDHNISNVNIIGCGNDGIHLERGFETSKIDNVRSCMNNRHGLYTGRTEGIDSATEYLSFHNCRFERNRCYGVYFTFWRKHIEFNGCYFSGNGQYNNPIAVDPLLGYDRTPPKNIKDAYGGICFANGNVEVDGSSMGLTVVNCLGEETIKGVHIENSTTTTGAIGNVTIENNTFYKGFINSEIGTCVYMNVKYIQDTIIRANYGRALSMLELGREYTDGGQTIIFSDDTKDINFLNNLSVKGEIISKRRIYQRTTLSHGLKSDTDGSTIEIDDIAKEYSIRPVVNTSTPLSVFSLTATWQATNADNFGCYLLFVCRLPSGAFKMSVLPTSSIEGFSNEPTLTSDGILQIVATKYFLYRLSRLDLEDLTRYW